MLVVGLICLLLGFLLGIPVLWTIGVVLTVIGLILLLIGSRRGTTYTGRRWYY